MAEPFIGEIKMVGFNFAPRGYATCDGQLLPIAQNTALFSILGTQYGGNGTSNFALPNFQGRSSMFWGQGPGLTPRFIGESAGVSSVTLLSNEMPAHNHGVNGTSTTGGLTSPQTATFSSAGRGKPPFYATLGTPSLMQP
ncbi:MAG TPA: tail fiber protein, partial [Pyrinomonadaceae bacterium]|nr:tail fiber protein [Pyrinomonadaceae bacterium]